MSRKKLEEKSSLATLAAQILSSPRGETRNPVSFHFGFGSPKAKLLEVYLANMDDAARLDFLKGLVNGWRCETEQLAGTLQRKHMREILGKKAARRFGKRKQRRLLFTLSVPATVGPLVGGLCAWYTIPPPIKEDGRASSKKGLLFRLAGTKEDLEHYLE